MGNSGFLPLKEEITLYLGKTFHRDKKTKQEFRRNNLFNKNFFSYIHKNFGVSIEGFNKSFFISIYLFGLISVFLSNVIEYLIFRSYIPDSTELIIISILIILMILMSYILIPRNGFNVLPSYIALVILFIILSGFMAIYLLIKPLSYILLNVFNLSFVTPLFSLHTFKKRISFIGKLYTYGIAIMGDLERSKEDPPIWGLLISKQMKNFINEWDNTLADTHKLRIKDIDEFLEDIYKRTILDINQFKDDLKSIMD